MFLNGFLVYTRECDAPVFGERTSLPSLTIPGDDINVAAAIRRITRGEIIPMRELRFGVDHGDMDLVDMQTELMRMHDQQQDSDKSSDKDLDKDSDKDSDKTEVANHEDV